MSAWIILALRAVGRAIEGVADEHHLRTDPACREHHAARAGSRLDRVSRGESCTPCMMHAAFHGCDRAPAGWWCSRDAGHEGPCAARPYAFPGGRDYGSPHA